MGHRMSEQYPTRHEQAPDFSWLARLPHGDRRLTAEAREGARRAARYATHAFRGPIGELISRELGSYVERGMQVPVSALGPRLVAAMQREEARHPLPPLPGYAHLPALPAPGNGLRWRYRTAADPERPARGTQPQTSPKTMASPSG
jgi:hypothetical protein